MRYVKQLIVPGMVMALVMTGCKSGTDSEQELQKLLERQTEMQESQEEVVQDLEQIRDSLDRQENSILSEREARRKRIARLQQNQQMLTERMRQDEQSEITTEKEGIQGQIQAYADSINAVEKEIDSLNARLDSIGTNVGFYDTQEDRTRQTLASGVSEIDRQITRRENQLRQGQDRAELLRKRLVLADEKLEVYRLEQELYETQLNERLRKTAPEDEISRFRQQIAEMDSLLREVRTEKQSVQNELEQLQASMTETEEMILRLRTQIDQEYDRQAIINEFIVSEKDRLQRELENLHSNHQQLMAQQERINQSLAGTEEQLTSLDRRAELVRNKEMSQILEEQASIARTEAGLAGEEARQLRQGGDTIYTAQGMETDTTNGELLALAAMSAELDSLQSLIQEEKAQIAQTRQELAQKRAEAADRRAKFGRTFGIVTVAIILAALGLLALFYFLGKRSRHAGT